MIVAQIKIERSYQRAMNIRDATYLVPGTDLHARERNENRYMVEYVDAYRRGTKEAMFAFRAATRQYLKTLRKLAIQ